MALPGILEGKEKIGSLGLPHSWVQTQKAESGKGKEEKWIKGQT